MSEIKSLLVKNLILVTICVLFPLTDCSACTCSAIIINVNYKVHSFFEELLDKVLPWQLVQADVIPVTLSCVNDARTKILNQILWVFMASHQNT